MQSAPTQSRYRLLGPQSGWVAAATAIALIIVAMGAAAGIFRLVGTGALPADIRFQDTEAGSPAPLGGFGAIPLPPSL